MKAALRKLWLLAPAGLAGILLSVLPLAAQESAPGPADTATGMVFRWLNFALVFGAIAYLVAKFGGGYFRGRANSIADSIHEAAEAHAAAQRELQEADRRLAAMDLELQDMRRAAVRESAAEAERLRELARAESDKIAQAARGEIAAAERVARQELRAMAAKLATERAAAMVRAEMTAAAEAALFHTFVGELERSAS